MSKPVTQSDFASEVRRQFAFLEDSGFLGPEEGDYRQFYSTGALGVEVMYDDRDRRVVTIVNSFVAGVSARAGLPCLYVESGLGPAQNIREIARSPKFLGPVLDTHATALRAVLSVLAGPTGPDLLRKCHGR